MSSHVKKRFSAQGESIFDDSIEAKYIHPLEKEESNEALIRDISLDAISPGKYQPRVEFDEAELTGLAESIMLHGVMQPILVRPNERGGYELIAGERRWRASKIAHTKTIPAIVRNLSDRDAMALGVIENIQRANLNPIEEALAYKRLLDEFSMTHEKISQTVGKSRATITNSLRLLLLSENIRQGLVRGSIQSGHAKALLSLNESDREKAYQEIANKKLSVREAESFVKQSVVGKRVNHSVKPKELLEKEILLKTLLGSRSSIKQRAGGLLEVKIGFSTEKQLDEFISLIQEG